MIRELGSETPKCTCTSEVERAENCPVHGGDAPRETAATYAREIGS